MVFVYNVGLSNVRCVLYIHVCDSYYVKNVNSLFCIFNIVFYIVGLVTLLWSITDLTEIKVLIYYYHQTAIFNKSYTAHNVLFLVNFCDVKCNK